jgi:hypothetical protein
VVEQRSLIALYPVNFFYKDAAAMLMCIAACVEEMPV